MRLPPPSGVTQSSSPAGFDRIAPFYRWLEYALFGPALQCCRTAFLPMPPDVEEVLVAGDGDARFLAAALRAHPTLRATAVDASPRMLALARQRCAFAAPRVTFQQADLIRCPVSPSEATLVATHFLFDCFAEAHLKVVIDNLAQATPTARYWLVSEFAIPHARPLRWVGLALTAFLYAFFRRAARISASQLVDYRPCLQAHGFHLSKEEPRLGGLLVAQTWERP